MHPDKTQLKFGPSFFSYQPNVKSEWKNSSTMAYAIVECKESLHSTYKYLYKDF